MLINDADDLRIEVKRLITEGFSTQLIAIETSKGYKPGSLNAQRLQPGNTGLLPRLILTHDVDSDKPVSDYPLILIASETVVRVEPRAPQYFKHDPEDPWDTGPDGDVFERTYGLVIHSWIMGQQESGLSRDRDIFESALWRTIHAGQFAIENARLRPDTWQSSWQETDLQGEGLITGISARFQVSVQEVISAPITNVASTIEDEVSHL